MKKLMMFLVCLIPFVLIFTIQITSVVIRKTTYVAVEKVSFESRYKEIIKDSSEPVLLDYSAKVTPLVATNKEVIYSSSDETIATVDANGLISFIGFGKVTITAKSSASGKISDYCLFYVTDIKPHFVNIKKHPTTMNVGEEFYIESEVVPNDALDKTVRYSSSNSAVLKVAPNGKLTALSKGMATITITAVNGVSDSFDVDVKVPVTGVAIDDSTYKAVTGNNRMELPRVNVYPVNASNTNVSFESQNPEIAKIEDGFIEFTKLGRATFVVTSEDGGYQDSWTIYYTGGFVLSAEIKDDYKQIEDVYQKDKVLANCLEIIEYDPDDADVLTNIIFESLDENVVKIENNKIVVKGGGKTRVKMIANTVSDPIVEYISISISRPTEEIVSSNMESQTPSFNLDWSVLPADHTDKISFSVNSDIASITSDGRISFVQQGSVEVTISANDTAKKTIVVSFKKPGTDPITLKQGEEQIDVNYLDEFSFFFDVSLKMGVVSYSGYDETVLRYDGENGIFTALKGGQTTINASSSTGSVTIDVRVFREVERLEVSSKDIDITANETIVTAKTQIKFESSVYPNDATNKEVTFEIEGEGNATISNDGLLEFCGAGEVCVIIKTSNDIQKTITIRSTFGLPESFGLRQTSVVLPDIGETFKIELADNFSPSDVIKSNLSPRFSVYDDSVAQVDLDGVVTAKSKGTTIIAVQVGNAIQQFNVEVQVKAKQIKIYYKGKEFSGGSMIGSTITLTSKVFPENSNNNTVEWSIIEGDVATISDSGVVSWSGWGTIKIEVRVVGTNITAEAVITRKNINKLSIYDKNDNDISPIDTDGKLTAQVLEIAPTNTEDIVLRVGIDKSEFIDPENVEYSMLTVAYVAEDGLEIEVVKNDDEGYYTIKKQVTTNKVLCVDITFSFGGVEASVKIQYNNLQSLTMDLDNADDVDFGLEGKRVFATKNYDAENEDKYNSVFKIGYTRKPADNCDTLYWFVDRSDLAYINENEELIISNSDFTEETKITVTVSNKPDLNDEDAITATYTYTFVGDARNVVNVYNQEDFNGAVGCAWSMVLQTSLGPNEDNADGAFSELTHLDYNVESNNTRFSFYTKIWGNGYVLNFNNFKNNSNSLFSSNKVEFCFYDDVRNITIKAENFDEDKDYTNVIVVSGSAVCEYVKFQQMREVWTASATINHAVTFKNCLFKHASQVGLQIGGESVGSTYLENTIFYDVAQAAVDYQNGSLYVKGIFDVYNFTSPSDYSGLSAIATKSVFEEAYQSTEFERFIYKGGSTKVDDWQANVAIVMLPIDGSSLTTAPKVSDVWFWNEESQAYVKISAGVENETGLNYERVSYDYQTWALTKKKSHMVYMVLSPYESSSYVQPDTVLTEEGEAKIYSPAKQQALANETKVS